MTELERTKLARTYIEKLSYGINPLNDMPVADEELINNAYIPLPDVCCGAAGKSC